MAMETVRIEISVQGQLVVHNIDRDVYESYQRLNASFRAITSCAYLHASWKDDRGRKHLELVHRRAMGCKKGDGKIVDHIDGDTTNSTRSNLRVVTSSGNNRNKRCRTSSGYYGVTKESGKFQARFKHKRLGTTYSLATHAAYHYDLVAKEANAQLPPGEVRYRLNHIEEPVGFQLAIKRSKHLQLPKGVFLSKGKLMVQINGKHGGYGGCFEASQVTEAKAVADKLFAARDEARKKEHMAKPVTRTHAGDMYLTTSCGQQVLLPSNTTEADWYTLTAKKWHIRSGRATNTKITDLARYLKDPEVPKGWCLIPTHNNLLDLRDMNLWQIMRRSDPRNTASRKRQRTNTSGYIGVSKKGTGWFANITYSGMTYARTYRKKLHAVVGYNRQFRTFYPQRPLPSPNDQIADDSSVSSLKQQHTRAPSTSGYAGVSKGGIGSWRAKLVRDGVTFSKSYRAKLDAVVAYNRQFRTLHPHQPLPSPNDQVPDNPNVPSLTRLNAQKRQKT